MRERKRKDANFLATLATFRGVDCDEVAPLEIALVLALLFGEGAGRLLAKIRFWKPRVWRRLGR